MGEAIIIVTIGVVVFCAINPFRVVGPIGSLLVALTAVAEAEIRSAELRARHNAKFRAALNELKMRERGNE